MLVEDDNNLREIYGARLQAEGHDIVSARDGEEALALAVKEKPELIISDVMMPRISGFDMLDILRNAPETKNTKVIMMTALSQVEDRARADKLGADKYLVKSQATLEDVVNAVNSVLNKSDDPAGNNKNPDPNKPSDAPVTSEELPTIEPAIKPEENPEISQNEHANVPVNGQPVGATPLEEESDTVDTTPSADAQSTSSSAEPEPQTSTNPMSEAESTNTQSGVAPTETPVNVDDTVNSVDAQQQSVKNEAPSTKIDINGVSEQPLESTDNNPTVPTETSPTAPPVVMPTPPDEVEKNPMAEMPENLPPTSAPQEEEVIGPNLAEALASEENTTQNVENEDKIPTQPVASQQIPVNVPPSEPEIVTGGPVQPTAPSPNDNETVDATSPQSEELNQPADHEQKDQTNTESTEATNPTTNDSHDKTDVLDDGYGKKKVIEPLNDITKGPDLDALLAAEEKMAPIPTPPANTTVVPATPSTAAESSTPPPTETTQSDPHSDIAL